MEDWLSTLEIDVDAVADVGGKKLPVKDRVKSWKANRYDILDLPEYDLNQRWEVAEVYDIVFCLEVFEYIYDPFQAIKNLYKILKPGGTLFVSFHFIYPHHGPWGMDYLRYTRWGVEKLLTEAGFQSWERYSRPFKRPQAITEFYAGEQMKGEKPNSPLHLDQGYLIEAVK
ncbi:MAG: methyltransferase [Deltaproteobacteria bacterium]|nr:methyltransferase [Deltaproteobacteria bacterium]